MAGRFSGVMAQQVSIRVRSEDGHCGGMGRLYPFATCIHRVPFLTSQLCNHAWKDLCDARKHNRETS